MSKVKELLKEYTAPLTDNYGEAAYEEVLSSLAVLLPAAIVAESSHIWRVSWMVDGKKVSTLYGSNNSQEEMEKMCARMATAPWKCPVVLEAIVETKVWK